MFITVDSFNVCMFRWTPTFDSIFGSFAYRLLYLYLYISCYFYYRVSYREYAAPPVCVDTVDFSLALFVSGLNPSELKPCYRRKDFRNMFCFCFFLNIIQYIVCMPEVKPDLRMRKTLHDTETPGVEHGVPPPCCTDWDKPPPNERPVSFCPHRVSDRLSCSRTLRWLFVLWCQAVVIFLHQCCFVNGVRAQTEKAASISINKTAKFTYCSCEPSVTDH